ncbi:Hpt domain-containing protein [Vibrio sp. S4M6]|uniref:Hpt domain-containing protein n=1 Tax=Vibrio sinus TaxID=2946865 RepID=UPI00202A2A26|nr:Hpt domain-containing protein [Vibrio sinus]MCL9783703.1 Hpt domain-containing protein [Vibrio sinus]
MGKGYKRVRWTWIVAIIWALVVVAVSMNYRANVASMQTLNKMSKDVEELQGILSYDTPFRIKHLDKVGGIIQKVYIQRVKLETELAQGFFNPDINQALYTIDRYIEHVRSFVKAETDVVTLVNNLRKTREKYVGQEKLESIYFQLSAYVLEAMYSDSSGSPAVYRALDKVFLLSQSLPSDQSRELQQVLGQISTVLGGYAQGNYLVEKLLEHSIHEQITHLENQYDSLLDVYLIIIISVSGFSIFVLTLSRERQNISVETMPEIGPQDIPVSQVEPAGEAAVIGTSIASHADEVVSQTEPTVDKQYSSKASEDVSTSVSDSQNLPVIDFDKLTDSLSGDVESVVLLLNVFVQDHRGDVQTLTSSLNDDHENALRAAHSLKGVAANLGANGLREAANEVEKTLKENGTVTPQMLETLDFHLQRSIREAEAYLKEKS